MHYPLRVHTNSVNLAAEFIRTGWDTLKGCYNIVLEDLDDPLAFQMLPRLHGMAMEEEDPSTSYQADPVVLLLLLHCKH